MNKRTNKELFLPKIMIAIALIAILGVALWGYFGQDTVAVKEAREAYAQYLSENPGSHDKDFIYIYNDTVIVAIRNGKIVRKEYATEADAVKAALGSKDGANYSLSGTGDGKLFVVKLFQKTDDIYALGSSTLAAGAEKLTIKVVSNGMIFATFEIPAEAIDRKQSPVGVTIKKIDPEDNVTLGKNETGFAYDIDVTNLVENNTARIAITMNGPRGLVSDNRNGAITAYHKDKNIVSTYDSTTGKISFSTTSFSPFTFTWEEFEVSTLEELRYYLQLAGRVNIKIKEGTILNINLDNDRHGADINDETFKYTNANIGVTNETTYYSKGYYDSENPARWLYFGALVFGEKSLDLNGCTITYTGTDADDSALFAVGDNSSFTIRDTSADQNGIIAIQHDQYAVWAVNDSSTVNILSGIFMADEFANAKPEPNRALIYSSGGEIHVRGGYFLYDNINEGKTNGGFNVLDEIKVPRIWIYEGVYLSNDQFRQTSGNDDDSIMLIGGASCSNEPVSDKKTVTTFKKTGESYEQISSWYYISGQTMQVKPDLNTDKYIYRVGNGNSFKLSAFFEKIGSLPTDENGKEIDISVRAVNIIQTRADIEAAKDAANAYDKENGYYGTIRDKTTYITLNDFNGLDTTVQFSSSFTGPVRLELVDSNDVLYASINLEVVDGNNVTADTQLTGTLGNVVLLNDITFSTSGKKFEVKSGTLFGNGFEINYNEKAYTSGGSRGIITLSSATLDNVKINGDFWKDYAEINSNDYYAAAVYATGESKILNSYIYGCQAALRIYGTTCLVENTTLDGGRLSNVHLMAGILTLNNVTTVQKTREDCLGFGVLVHNEAQKGTKIIVKGDLKQYNWITEDDKGYLPGSASTYASTAFGMSQFVYTYDDTKYVNLGIISICADVTADDIDIPDGYGTGKSGSACVVTCTKEEAEKRFVNGSAPSYDGWTATQQGAVEPNFTWKHPEGYVDGSITVSFTLGQTYELDPNFLTALKYGKELGVKVYLDDVDYTGKKISFTESGNHTLKFVITDPYNYSPATIAVSKGYEFVISLTVNATKALKNADFTYTADSSAGKIVYDEVNKKYYVTHASGGSGFYDTGIEINGQKIYAPVVNIIYNNNLSDFSGYAPIFSAINITDYAGGEETGAQTVYKKNASALPTNFSFVGNGPYLTGTGNAKAEPVTYESTLCYESTLKNTSSNNIEASEVYYKLVEYQYQDNAGKVFNYYIRYYFGTHTWKNPVEECITPDTLITLADGSQVRVDSLTGKEQLLVWNLKTGKYEAAPIVFVDSEVEKAYEIIHLYFSDGADVKVISEHGFFDLDLGKYVYIDVNNYLDYVGHRFVSEGDISENAWNVVTLDEVKIETEVTTAWSPVTFEHLCYYTNGVLSMPGGIDGLFNIFEVDTETMTYDAEKMQQDIDTYGLLTLEDFGGMVPQAAFDAFNGQYLGIAIGKGLLTWEQIAALAERYVPLM